MLVTACKTFVAPACVIARYAHSTEARTSEATDESSHVYRNLYPWKTKSEFVDHLAQSIFYNEGGLVALSKPYGVGVASDLAHRGLTSNRRLHIAGVGESWYCLGDALDALAKRLGVERLVPIKSAERYASGLTLLASHPGVLDGAKRALLRCKPMCLPHVTAWVITKGYPLEDFCRERVAMKFVEFNGDRQVTVVRDFSVRETKRKLVKPVLVECRTAAKNTTLSVALLAISTTSTQWHFLRVYPTTKATCVLGDSLHSLRVADLLGKSVGLGSRSASARPQARICFFWSCHKCRAFPSLRQVLPDTVCRRLDIPKGVEGHRWVPAMIHYRSLLLPGYRGREDLLLADPRLPPHFEWTLQRLELLPQEK